MLAARHQQTTTRQTRQSPQRPQNPEVQELLLLKKQLIQAAKSQATAEILKKSSIPELRGIQKTMTAIDFSPTLMEWTTHLFLEAVRHPEAPSAATVHQWKNAMLFIHERMKTRNCANPGEEWMQRNQQVVLPTIVKEYRGITEAAVKFLAQQPLKFFFNGMLCFASHFAKHGVCLKMKVADYLQKAADLYQQTPFIENGAQCYRRHGWTVYVTHDKGNSYIKTLHLKAAYHEKYLVRL